MEWLDSAHPCPHRVLARQQTESHSTLTGCIRAVDVGEHQRARDLLEASLEMAREVGDKDQVVHRLYDLAVNSLRCSDWALARQYAEREMAVARELGDNESSPMRSSSWRSCLRSGILRGGAGCLSNLWKCRGRRIFRTASPLGSQRRPVARLDR